MTVDGVIRGLGGLRSKEMKDVAWKSLDLWESGIWLGEEADDQCGTAGVTGGGGQGPAPDTDPDPGGWPRTSKPDSGEGGGGTWFLAWGQWCDGRKGRGGVVSVQVVVVGVSFDPDSDPEWWGLILTGGSGGDGGSVRFRKSGKTDGGLAAGGGDSAETASGGGGVALKMGGGWHLGKGEGRGGLGLELGLGWNLGLEVGPYENGEEAWAWMELLRGANGLPIKASHRDITLARLRE